MDRKGMELLLDLNRTHSLTASAQSLGITQSALSHSVKKMEKQLGFALLSRSNHGVGLSAEAKYLLPYMQSVLSQYAVFEEAVHSLQGLKRGSITIGTYSSIAIQWLPAIIQEFRQSYPDIQIHVREGYADQILRWIREESIDFGFLSDVPGHGFHFLPFTKEPLYAVAGMNFSCPEEWKGKFPMQAFAQYPFIASEIGVDKDVVAALHQEDVDAKIQFYCKQDQSILAMVKRGLGLSLLPSLILKDVQDVQIFPLAQEVNRSLGIMYASEQSLSTASKKFMEVAQTIVATL